MTRRATFPRTSSRQHKASARCWSRGGLWQSFAAASDKGHSEKWQNRASTANSEHVWSKPRANKIAKRENALIKTTKVTSRTGDDDLPRMEAVARVLEELFALGVPGDVLKQIKNGTHMQEAVASAELDK